MDTRKQEAEARSKKAAVRDTLVRAVFHLLPSHFPRLLFLHLNTGFCALVRLQLTGVTHDLDVPSLAVRG